MPSRNGYPCDVTNEEWAFIAPYLALIPFDSPQRRHDPRAVLNPLRWVVRTGAQRAFLPNDFPEPQVVREQAGSRAQDTRTLGSVIPAGVERTRNDPQTWTDAGTPDV